MRLRCWPGAIARVIRDQDFPQNVGAVVLVVGRVTDPEAWVNYTGEEWVIKPWSRPMWAYVEDDRSAASFDMSELTFRDRDLVPLTPPPGAETETVADVLEAARSETAEA